MKVFLLRTAAWMIITSAALTSCRKPPKRKREEVVADITRDRRRVDNFAYALRKVVEWRQTQPPADSEANRLKLIKSVVKKLDQVPDEALPADLAQAWQRVLKSWRLLAKAPKVDDDLIKEGTAAASELNTLLAANGYPDLRL